MTPENILKTPETLERNETVRIEQFSDGVFAIAITLLVLGITVPKARDLGAGGSLGSTLIKLWPHYLAFATSFITIFAKWVNHHRIFSFIQRTDHPFLYWNGLLLLFITFMPFPRHCLLNISSTRMPQPRERSLPAPTPRLHLRSRVCGITLQRTEGYLPRALTTGKSSRLPGNFDSDR